MGTIADAKFTHKLQLLQRVFHRMLPLMTYLEEVSLKCAS